MLLQRRYRLPERPIVVTNSPLLMPADQREDIAPSLRQIVGVDDGVPLVVYSGWLAPERGVMTLVQAVERLPGVHLAIVVGQESAHRRDLEQLARKLGIGERVHFAPYVPAHQVSNYLSSATIGAIPLLHEPNNEIALNTKYREYMHARLPIVVSDVRTMSQYTVDHGNGVIFMAGNPASCAEAISKVVAEPERYASAYTEELLVEHKWQTQQQRLLQLYERLLKSRPTPRASSFSLAERLPTEPEPAISKDGPPRLVGFGPANYAGQAWAWAKALERNCPGTETEVFAWHHPVRNFPADRYLMESRSLRAQIRDTWHMLDDFSHLLADGLRPFLGLPYSETLRDDLGMALGQGIMVGIVCHGSEIRDPSRHRENHPQSPFDPDLDLTRSLQDQAERNAHVISEFSGPVFVSTPDLLDDVPGAIWLPVAVDHAKWRSTQPLLERDRPLAIHIPTNRQLKGTDLIEPAVRRLARAGFIEYRSLSGISPKDMPGIIRTADIVLDQFALGSYGVLACQAMAAGRVVVGHVHDCVRERLPGELPIVEATGATIADVLESVVAERDLYRKAAWGGAEFVREVHDGRRSAEVIMKTMRLGPFSTHRGTRRNERAHGAIRL
jgi:glycosyltransferase involved in cell wall biosynthesis